MILLYTPILNGILKTAITYLSIHIFRSLSSIFSIAYRSVVLSFAVVIRLLIKLVFISQNYGFISLRNQTYGYKIKTKV